MEPGKQRVAILAPRSTIGQSVVERLGKSDCPFALIGRNLSGLRTDSASYAATCDLTDFDAVHEALGHARDSLGGLTGVVNCAGSMLLKPAHLTTRQEFDGAIESNLATAFATVRASVAHLDSSGGSVVLISSAAATLGMPNHELIGAAKAAVEGLVRSAAATYASRSIRFNGVAPGLVASNLSERLVTNKATLKVSESLHPLGRIGKPDEVARAICWLLDPAQSWVTGQIIGVDGGLSRVQPRVKL
ncbi:MAG TPA: SDR family oxidoreductase [Candidatus Hydrogenedentes bacterium]|nr:SDR family oxidoreductase [Candidatus Hydrogenedentota bacterium]